MDVSTAYLSLISVRVNLVDRIYAIMDNFLKFLHFFQRKEREGREEVTSCSVSFGEYPFALACMAFRPPLVATS